MSAIQEPSVREMAGVKATRNVGTEETRWVEVREGNARLSVTIDTRHAYLSVDEARKLARQLYRLALRIEKRRSLDLPDKEPEPAAT